MKVRLRTQQIIFDSPTTDSEWWIQLTVQRVEMDDAYNPINVVDRWGTVNVKLADLAMQTFPLIDPVKPPSGIISVAGLAVSLEVVAVSAIIAKYGGTLDDNGYIMVL